MTPEYIIQAEVRPRLALFFLASMDGNGWDGAPNDFFPWNGICGCCSYNLTLFGSLARLEESGAQSSGILREDTRLRIDAVSFL